MLAQIDPQIDLQKHDISSQDLLKHDAIKHFVQTARYAGQVCVCVCVCVCVSCYMCPHTTAIYVCYIYVSPYY